MSIVSIKTRSAGISLPGNYLKEGDMDTIGKLLGIVIAINVIAWAFNENIGAVLGWVVALLEWSRRFTLKAA